ncbi:MAG: branched-chain amino acid ABC transporter permease, partial [Gemmataceae bacterium]
LTLTHLSDDYFAIVTLGFAEAIRIVADNEIWLTHGSDGISGIPQPFKSALGSDFNLFYLGLCLVLLLLTLLLLERIRVSPFGRVLRAIRDDPQVTAVAGKNVLVFKIKAFALGGVIAGLAGALYGHYTSYIVPQIFEPMLTIYIFLALTAGGRGNNWGAALGAFLVVFLLESSDFATAIIPGIGKVQIAAAREMLIGLLFLVVLRVWPRGILPEPRPRHALLLRASNLSAEPGRQAANFSFLRKL